jgi:hypothetical protein
MTLSVATPIFNERSTLRPVFGRVLAVTLPGKDGAETDGHHGEGRAGCSIRPDGSESCQHQSRRDFQGKPGDQFACQAAWIVEVPMVTGIQHRSSADSSTVVVNLEDQVQHKAHRLPDPDRIYFDLRDTQLASNLAWKSIEVVEARCHLLSRRKTSTGCGKAGTQAFCAADDGVVRTRADWYHHCPTTYANCLSLTPMNN